VLRTYRSLLYHSVLDRFNNASIASRQTEHAVLPQDAVSDVFQLCDHSKSRVRTPFNEIRLAFHRLTSFFLISCTTEMVNRGAAMISSACRPRDSYARAVLEFACRAPFVSYWCVRVDMLTPGLGFSKMLSVQQRDQLHIIVFALVS
jgi:hypothetical protein